MRIVLNILIQIGQQKKLAQGSADADADMAHAQLGHLLDSFFPFLNTDKGSFHLFIQVLPFFGQGNPPGIAYE